MKTKEEIDEVYKKLYLSLDDSPHYHTWVRGYTQCQKDSFIPGLSKETLDELFEAHDSEDFIDEDSDKKYTEEDLRKAFNSGVSSGWNAQENKEAINADEYINSLKDE
jgi:hypothetical protein